MRVSGMEGGFGEVVGERDGDTGGRASNLEDLRRRRVRS